MLGPIRNFKTASKEEVTLPRAVLLHTTKNLFHLLLRVNKAHCAALVDIQCTNYRDPPSSRGGVPGALNWTSGKDCGVLGGGKSRI